MYFMTTRIAMGGDDSQNEEKEAQSKSVFRNFALQVNLSLSSRMTSCVYSGVVLPFFQCLLTARSTH